MIAKRFTEPAPRVRELRPEVPEALDRAVSRALCTLPDERFQTAAEFRDALANLMRDTSEPVRVGRRLLLTGVAAFGLYATCALLVLGGVEVLTRSLGLPDWVVPGAVMLLGLGLPVVLMTAIVQQRRASGIPLQLPAHLSKAPHWLTGRRAIGGGGLAFAALGGATAGYMALRALGIGPVGTLLAAGTLQPRERLLLADFQNRTRDTLMGSLVSGLIPSPMCSGRGTTAFPRTTGLCLTFPLRTAMGSSIRRWEYSARR
jgi:eukaryotic-like serine/threonine-protein kinase